MISSNPVAVGGENAILGLSDSSMRRFWLSNRGAILILLAEACSSGMDAIARYLQQGENGMHAFQIVFVRMSVTFVISLTWLWLKQTPDFPLGHRSVRPLLLLRSLFGFVGIFCLYYSVHYLPLAEATVFRFLAPLITAYACSLLLDLPFTRIDFLVSALALVGITIIAHPASIIGGLSTLIGNSYSPTLINIQSSQPDTISPAQRLLAVLTATLGIFGAAGAYTTIRLIGNRAHALLSVTHYAFLCTVGSALFLIILPDIGFTTPHGIQWGLLLMLGLLGFALQYLLTKGLQLDSSSKATSMMYSQVVYALAFDWAIWGVLPDRWDLVGGSLVVASTLWSSLSKPNMHPHAKPGTNKVADEENPLLGDSLNEDSEIH